jgi:hypothetical protein
MNDKPRLNRRRYKQYRFAHYDDIRSEIIDMVERLCELHDSTHPRLGKRSEAHKHNRAQRAIAIWWYIYARLMLWVQSHVIGYEMARLNPNLQRFLSSKRGDDLDENSHKLEQLGSMYAVNSPSLVHNEKWSTDFSNQLEKLNIGLDDETLRRVIVRLLLSTSADSSVWRFPISHALTALNYGEQQEFVKPSKKRRRGQPYRLDRTRSNAISHVYYLIGKGMKKHVALDRVSAGIAVSPETLRDWEKSLRADDWFTFTWEAAWIAGQIEAEPKLVPSEVFDISYYGITDNIELARIFLQDLNGEVSLAQIRKNLRKYHNQPGGLSRG